KTFNSIALLPFNRPVQNKSTLITSMNFLYGFLFPLQAFNFTSADLFFTAPSDNYTIAREISRVYITASNNTNVLYIKNTADCSFSCLCSDKYFFFNTL